MTVRKLQEAMKTVIEIPSSTYIIVKVFWMYYKITKEVNMVYYIENEKETINFTIEKDNIIILQDNECILNIMLNEYFSKELNINEKILLPNVLVY